MVEASRTVAPTTDSPILDGTYVFDPSSWAESSLAAAGTDVDVFSPLDEASIGSDLFIDPFNDSDRVDNGSDSATNYADKLNSPLSTLWLLLSLAF